jgi:hypothetical protein
MDLRHRQKTDSQLLINAVLGQNGTASGKVAMRVESLDAGTGFVGPFELDGVVAERAGFPRTDVTDLAMDVIVPTLAGNGIGDGLA